MTTLDTLKAALQARRGADYIDEFDAYTDGLTDAVVDVGAGMVATSTTSATIGTGAQSLTVQAEKNFAVGQYVEARQTSAAENFMAGVVTAYNQETGVLAFTVATGDTGGGGTITDWTVTVSGRRGAAGSAGSMTGPGSSTDNVWPRFNGAGGSTLQNGTWTESDAGNVTAGGTLDMSGYDLTVDLVTVEAAGENAEGNATNATGEVTLQATGTPVLRHTLTGDVTYLVAGAPTPGKGWQVEVRPTQDGTGGRAGTILPANLFTYSEDFRNTADTGSPAETRPWTRVRVSISTDAVAAPDGRTTADKLVEDASATTNHYVTRTPTLDASTVYTLSVYAKAAERSQILVTGYRKDGTQPGVYFNLSTGAVISTQGSPTTYDIEDVGSGWYRCWVAYDTLTGGATTDIYLVAAVAGSQIYSGDGASGIYIWGAQLVAGSSPLGYAAVTATRAGMVTWRVAADEIDFAAQAASTASRILISYGSDGEILVDDVSLVS